MTSTLPSDLLAILEPLKLTETASAWQAGWAESGRSYPGPALPALTPGFVAEQSRRLKMGEPVRAALLDGLALFERQPTLKQLFWHCHHTLFKRTDFSPKLIKSWPLLPPALDRAAPLFYAYVYLSGVPQLLGKHRRRGIPETISLDSLSDLERWLQEYHRQHGVWGLSEVFWLGFLFSGRLYQLGRLQFEPNHYYLDYQAYRHRQNGQVVILAGDGMRFRQDGLPDGTNDIYDERAWTATISRVGETVCGFLVNLDGYAQGDAVTLQTAEWEPILKRGDPTIGVHIPATGPMDYAACGRSFAQAIPFFARYFPDHPISAFVCSSWLLDPQLAAYLSPESNIVRFLKVWHLTAIPNASDHQFFARIFGLPPTPIDQLPTRTTLQRAIVQHMRAGGRWRDGSGLIFPHAFRWGDS